MFGRKKTGLEFPRLTPQLVDEYRRDPVRFAQEQVVCLLAGEDTWGKPTIYPLQANILNKVLTTRGADGLRSIRRGDVFLPKKFGKTFTCGLIVSTLICTERNHQALLVSPAVRQTRETAFGQIADSFDRNPKLKKQLGVTIEKDSIKVAATNSEVLNIPVGSGGGVFAAYNPSIVFCDELSWWTTRKLEEAYKTLNHPPLNRPQFLFLTASYGPTDRSKVMLRVIQRAKKGNLLEDHFFCWIHGREQVLANAPSWYTEDALERVRREVDSAREFRRVYLCEKVASSDDSQNYLFSSDEVERCTDPTWAPQTSRPANAVGPVYIGADYGWKFDFSAVAAIVQLRNGPAALLDGRMKGGTRKQPLPEAWILETVEEFLMKFGYCKLALDPTELRHVIDKLRGRVEIIELSHKKPTIAAALRRFISDRKFRMYPNAMQAEWPHEPGRVLTLQSILRHVQWNPDTAAMDHAGNLAEKGRWFDDGPEVLGMCLSQIEAENATAMRFDISSWMEPHEDSIGDGAPHRMFTPPATRMFQSPRGQMCEPPSGGHAGVAEFFRELGIG